MPHLTPYQIGVPLLSALMLLYAWSLAARHKKTLWEAILWTIFWGMVATIAIEPDILSYLTTLTGIKNQVNAILVTSIGILFFIVFSIVVRIEELGRRHTRLVRALALQDAGIAEKEKESTRQQTGLQG